MSSMIFRIAGPIPRAIGGTRRSLRIVKKKEKKSSARSDIERMITGEPPKGNDTLLIRARWKLRGSLANARPRTCSSKVHEGLVV